MKARRSLVCAALAGLLLGALLWSPGLRAALVSLPKTWTSGEVLTAADLNAQFAALLAQLNGNLSDENIAAGANIQGSKLADAPNGVTGAKLNDLSVDTPKLAIGSTIPTVASFDGLCPGLGPGSPESLVAELILTTRGGPIFVQAVTHHVLFNLTGSTADNMTIGARVLLDGTAATVDGTEQANATQEGRVAAFLFVPLTLAMPIAITGVPAGTHRVKLAVRRISSLGVDDVAGAAGERCYLLVHEAA